MLSREKKMSRQDFNNLPQKESEHHSPHFLLKTYPSPANSTKYAVIVSSKVAKRAVERNLLRRRVYDVIRQHEGAYNGKRVHIIAKKGTPTLSFTDIKKEITTLLNKVHM